MKAWIMAGAVLASGAAMAGWFGPSNYEECVLDNMKGVTSNTAAVAIARACQAKFPPPPPPPPTEAERAAEKAIQERCAKTREAEKRKTAAIQGRIESLEMTISEKRKQYYAEQRKSELAVPFPFFPEEIELSELKAKQTAMPNLDCLGH